MSVSTDPQTQPGYNATPSIKGEAGKDSVSFTYTGPYPIGVGWAVTKRGHVYHSEATLEPGEVCVFHASEGITHVSCAWGYDKPIVMNVPRLAAAS